MKLLTISLALSSLAFAEGCPGTVRSIHNVPPDLRPWLEYYALTFGLEPELLQALVFTESRYCPDALGPRYTHGRAGGGIGSTHACHSY